MEGFAKLPEKPAVATYSFNGMDLRVVEIDGAPWFVAKDVCSVLDLKAKYATNRCDGDEKRKVARSDLGMLPGQAMIIVSESGLYKLVMRSDKKEAKQFQDWVTREVLPSIRKTGTYTMPGAKKTIEAPKPSEAKNVPPPL